jgi:hypothetical protein
MSERYLTPTLTDAGQPVRADHRAFRSGANVLTLISCSSELGTELQSTYVGDERQSRVLVAEYVLAGGDQAQIAPRWLGHSAGILTYAPSRCLLDHLHRFCELAEQSSGRRVGVEDLERAERELAESEPAV